MKKTLIALAALAATGAFAQSTVTLYGAVDAGLTRYSSEGVSKTGLGNSQLGSSKLGFMGSEDLGNGMKANFKLEGGLANDSGNGKPSNINNQATGGLTVAGTPATAAIATLGGTQGLVFQRYAYVGLSGGFGEVRLGRDYTSTFLGPVAGVDPFGTNGPADSSAMTLKLAGATASNVSNSIGYTTPAMGGFAANAQIFFGENASNATTTVGTTAGVNNSKAGNGYSVVASYANGPIYASLGQQKTEGNDLAGDYTQRALSASYDFGMAKVAYTHVREIADLAVGEATNKSNLLGVTVPFGAFNVKASYVRSVLNAGAGAGDNTGTLFGLGADYALSKRTAVYGTWSRVKNDNGSAFFASGASGLAPSTATNPSSQGLAFGVKHNF